MAATDRWVLLGFGEVGALFAALLDTAEPRRAAYVFTRAAPSSETRERLARAKLPHGRDPHAVAAADVVVSAVSPAQATAVAHEVARHLKAGALYVDLNSITAERAVEVERTVRASGASFVDGAILGPVPLQRERVPIVLAGSAASRFHELATQLGLNTAVISERPGDASRLKLLWSVVTKGMIALVAEALIAGRRAGLLRPLLSLLEADFGRYGSEAMVARLLESSTHAGRRRVEEMAGARQTVAAAGVTPFATDATLAWLRTLAGLGGVVTGERAEDVVAQLDQALGQLAAAGSPGPGWAGHE